MRVDGKTEHDASEYIERIIKQNKAIDPNINISKEAIDKARSEVARVFHKFHKLSTNI